MLAPYPIAIAPAYYRHRPEQTPLYAIVAKRYPRFVQAIEQSGGYLPKFVRQEFEEYLKCGLLEHGFLRVKCDGCRHEHPVAFSCKRRGFCPSCGTRRMVEAAAHLVDHVIPLLDTLSRRIVRVLERSGLLIADPEHPSLDLLPDSSLDHLQAASLMRNGFTRALLGLRPNRTLVLACATALPSARTPGARP